MNSTKTIHSPTQNYQKLADRTLKNMGALWFIVAVIGQWIFAFYVAMAYGGSAIQGDFEYWNKISPHAFVAGEPMGNIAFGLHMILAVIIMLGGPLQFTPQVRKRFPTFHRWNGRVYLLTVFLTSADGIYMTYTRGAAGATSGVLLDAILVMLFTIPTLRYAMKGKIQVHMQWAFRLFIVASGVWFFRVMLMLWLFIHGKVVGFDPETFQGPFITFVSYGNYLLPLAILELYFWVKKRGGLVGKFSMSMFMLVLTVLTALGIFATTMGMWLPKLGF